MIFTKKKPKIFQTVPQKKPKIFKTIPQKRPKIFYIIPIFETFLRI